MLFKIIYKKIHHIQIKIFTTQMCITTGTFTSNIPSSRLNRVTSRVPPPTSYIIIFFSFSLCLSNPYAIAAAVGSLIIRSTFNPQIAPASFVLTLRVIKISRNGDYCILCFLFQIRFRNIFHFF